MGGRGEIDMTGNIDGYRVSPNITNTIWIFPIDTLASDLGMDHNHPIFGTQGGYGLQVKK